MLVFLTLYQCFDPDKYTNKINITPMGTVPGMKVCLTGTVPGMKKCVTGTIPGMKVSLRRSYNMPGCRGRPRAAISMVLLLMAVNKNEIISS